jgi:hypothetical protein
MIELALCIKRRIGVVIVAVAWTLSGLVAFCLPATPRSAEVANFSDDVSLGVTVVYAIARLGRAHINDVKWALTDAEDRADRRLLQYSGSAMTRSD